MKFIKTYENYLTKKNTKKNNLYDKGFGDIYYICYKCDSYKLTPIQIGDLWYCNNCGEMNYKPKHMHIKDYNEYIKEKEIKKNTKKYNL